MQQNYIVADQILEQLKELNLPALEVNVGTSNGDVDPLEDRVEQPTRQQQPRAIRSGYKLELKDVPQREGGGTMWNIIPAVPLILSDQVDGNDRHSYSSYSLQTCNVQVESCTVLQLAHMALGLATVCSKSNVPMDSSYESRSLVERAERRLIETKGTDLYGRSAADAAFWFALAGVNATNTNLFEYLVRISTNELLRYGNRPSCAPKNILHIVERLAAAGLPYAMVHVLHNVAADCLEQKGYTDTEIVQALRDGTFGLHSDRPLLLLWKFSTKQRKQRAFLDSAARHWEKERSLNATKRNNASFNKEEQRMNMWSTVFEDTTKPLVVDIGCGMGVSLLGLCSLSFRTCDAQAEESSKLRNVDWSQCNFAGVDLSRLAIGYANGVAQRLGFKGRVRFFVSSAEDFLARVVDSYPGDVKLVMIQFPTPFRLVQDTSSDRELGEEEGDDEYDGGLMPVSSDKEVLFNQGNSQLPTNVKSGFMVTQKLLRLASLALIKTGGRLLLQSNCEDVAVTMRDMAINFANFRYLDVPNKVYNVNDAGRRIPQRTALYIAMGCERAEGDGWSQEPILPRKGSTETELACQMNETPVHRCIFIPSTVASKR